MIEQELKALIRQVVSDVLAAERHPTGLVMFSGAMLGFEAACRSLSRLGTDVDLDWTQTPSASRILDQQRIAAAGMRHAEESLVTAHDLLIVPTLTVNLASKVAHGIGDCLASNVMAEFIMSGKTVVVATNGVCPDGADKRAWFPAMPAGYADMLRGTLDTLKTFGVRFSTAETLDAAVLRAVGRGQVGAAPEPASAQISGRVVTAATISTLPRGSRVRIAHDAIITDLARDTARDAGITWLRATQPQSTRS